MRENKVIFNPNVDIARAQALAGQLLWTDQRLPEKVVGKATINKSPDVQQVLHSTSLSTLKSYDLQLERAIKEMETGESRYEVTSKTNPHIGRFKNWQELINLKIRHDMWVMEEEAVLEERKKFDEEIDNEIKQLETLDLAQSPEARAAKIKELKDKKLTSV